MQRDPGVATGRALGQRSERTVQTSASLRRIPKSREEIAEEAAAALNAPGGFRPGLSADEVACRLRERRVMELEKAVEQLQMQNEVLSLESNPVALALRGQLPPPRLLLGPIGSVGPHHVNETVDFTAQNLRVAKPCTPSVLDIVQAYGEGGGRGVTPAAAVVMPWKRHPPLSPLQSMFQPDASSLPLLQGEASSSMDLSAPFSKKQRKLPPPKAVKRIQESAADATLITEAHPRSLTAPI